ncbi:hypothetical protein CDAR_34781 [Caerostris darwini]|uniref:Uncharacterized protein n=1 Tax=Caerostris darwini TaxID=1538125 RepID=A0AAV4RUZ0_9ARAC|nr:hypothetical protein CDAR_34781 [Caerostris darwini]
MRGTSNDTHVFIELDTGHAMHSREVPISSAEPFFLISWLSSPSLLQNSRGSSLYIDWTRLEKKLASSAYLESGSLAHVQSSPAPHLLHSPAIRSDGA